MMKQIYTTPQIDMVNIAIVNFINTSGSGAGTTDPTNPGRGEETKSIDFSDAGSININNSDW